MELDEKANKREKSLRRVALFIICICFTYLFAVTFVPVFYPGTKFENNYSNTIIGIILLLIAYYWGSSSGSAIKSQTIENKLNGSNPPVTSQTVTLKSTETVDKTTEMTPPVPKNLLKDSGVKVEEVKEVVKS